MQTVIVGGSRERYMRSGTWLDAWLASNGHLPRFCAVYTCMAPPEIGALVRPATDADGPWRVVPMCAAHGCLPGGKVVIRKGRCCV